MNVASPFLAIHPTVVKTFNSKPKTHLLPPNFIGVFQIPWKERTHNSLWGFNNIFIWFNFLLMWSNMPEHDFLDFELMSNFTLCRAIDLLSALIISYWLSLLLIVLCAFPDEPCALSHPAFSTLNSGKKTSEQEQWVTFCKLHKTWTILTSHFLSSHSVTMVCRIFCFIFVDTKRAEGRGETLLGNYDHV